MCWTSREDYLNAINLDQTVPASLTGNLHYSDFKVAENIITSDF